MSQLRREWRTCGDALGDAGTRLSGAVDHAVQAREGLMDIKHLELVDGDGIQLWRPVMKSPLPISPADARAGFAALSVDAPPLELESYDVADLARAGTRGDARAGAQVASPRRVPELHRRAHRGPDRPGFDAVGSETQHPRHSDAA